MSSYDILICAYIFVLSNIKNNMFTLYISTIYDDPYVIEVIGVFRQKYTTLQSTIPIILLQNDPTVQLTTLDKMVRVLITC